MISLSPKNTNWLFAAGAAIMITVSYLSCSKHATLDTDKSSIISDFKIVQTVKTAQRNFIAEGDDAYFGDSIRIYSTNTVAIQWPEVLGGYDIKPLQDSLLVLAFGTEKLPIDEAISNSLEHPQGSDYYTLSPVDSVPYSDDCMVLYRTIIGSAVTFSPQFIVYRVMSSVYDGGAHGLTLSHYLTYVFGMNRVLDFGTAFNPDSQEAILKAIKDQLMTDYGVTSLNDLSDSGIFVDQLYVSPDFYIHGYDIVFHYNPYDIASFAAGSINVNVPYHTIAEYLSPEMLAIMERSGV